MNSVKKRKGPFWHRFLIGFLSVLLTILFIWLWNFIHNDIRQIPGPDYSEIKEKYVDRDLLNQLEAAQEKKQQQQLQIETRREIQQTLQTSTQNSQQTMNQLLEMHRHKLEQGIESTETEKQTLAESEQIFIENQKKFQEINLEIAQLNEQLRSNEEEIKTMERQFAQSREEAREEYNQLMQAHRFKIACITLAVLIPILLWLGWFLYKKRDSSYKPVVLAAFIATFWQTGLVMHANFPMEFFKYIALGAAIVIVLAFLAYLIRMMISPRKDWLLKQNREAYTNHLCPVCSYPIKRGPFKFMIWTSRGPVTSNASFHSDAQEDDSPYTCPSCGTQLYEECTQCKTIRPSLLPHCQGCGTVKEIA